MWIKAILSNIIKETDLTWKFVIKPESKFAFKPGQFVQIKVNDLVRSYSIASYNSALKSLVEEIVSKFGS